MNGKKAILCVDDEKVILDSLKSQLKKHFGNEYTYEMAENANEAMEIIDELATDGVKLLIIVSDWLMPGIKGDEFLVQVHRKYPGIVKVMLTGQANDEAIKRAREEANLFSFIPKPWNEEELIRIIDSGLNGRSQ